MKYFTIYLQPKTIFDFIIFILFVLFILTLFILLFIYNFNRTKKEKIFLVFTYCKKFNLNDYQIELIKNIFRKLFYLNVSYFFNNEVYFDESLKFYLKRINANDHTQNDYKIIKEKIQFTQAVPTTSKEIPLNQNVKLKLKHVGFISGCIINNDDDGILIRTYFKNAIKKSMPYDNISIYYWDDNYQFEVHSTLKKISKVNYIQYLLVKQGNLIIKNKETQGFTLNDELPVFFTHIFKLPKDINIESHYFRGYINTFSMIGAEIFTDFKVTPSGIFLFEFHPINNKIDTFHFTGKIEEYSKLKKGKLLFVKYLDMNENCRKYIYQLILDKMNEQKYPKKFIAK